MSPLRIPLFSRCGILIPPFNVAFSRRENEVNNIFYALVFNISILTAPVACPHLDSLAQKARRYGRLNKPSHSQVSQPTCLYIFVGIVADGLIWHMCRYKGRYDRVKCKANCTRCKVRFTPRCTARCIAR